MSFRLLLTKLVRLSPVTGLFARFRTRRARTTRKPAHLPVLLPATHHAAWFFDLFLDRTPHRQKRTRTHRRTRLPGRSRSLAPLLAAINRLWQPGITRSLKKDLRRTNDREPQTEGAAVKSGGPQGEKAAGQIGGPQVEEAAVKSCGPQTEEVVGQISGSQEVRVVGRGRGPQVEGTVAQRGGPQEGRSAVKNGGSQGEKAAGRSGGSQVPGAEKRGVLGGGR